MDENKIIVSTEMKQALVNLRNLEEIYVIMSGVTKMPFVLCDEETFDDEQLRKVSQSAFTGIML